MKRASGSISIYIALIFLLIVSIFTATIRAARANGAQVVVEYAASLALDSVFAEYDKELFTKFGVLLFDNSGGRKELEGKLYDYMDYNINMKKDLILAGKTDLYGIDFKGVRVASTISPTDYGGLIWQDMAVDYEKYAKPINLAADYMKLDKMQEESTAVSQISDKILECADDMLSVNSYAKELVKYVDGIYVESGGINFKNLTVDTYFLKRLCPGELSTDNVRIYDKVIYEEVSKEIWDPVQCMETYIDSYGKDNETCDYIIEHIMDYLDGGISCARKIQETCESIDKEYEKLADSSRELDSLVNENNGILSSDVMSGFQTEIDNIHNYKQVLANDICDTEAIKQGAVSNLNVLIEAQEILKNLDENNYKEKMEKAIPVFQKITFAGMSFNYDNLKAVKDDSDSIDSIRDALEKGVLRLAMPAGMSISKKKITYDNRASDCCDIKNEDTYQAKSDGTTKLEKRTIYTEYMMDNFYSFTDKKNSRMLDYEIEYILEGEDSDEENLQAVVSELVLIRSGFNMVYLMTDSAKKTEAYSVAYGMIGYLGIEPLTRIVQYSLLYLWSYGEAICDVKTLLGGGKIPAVKTKKDWKLGLTNLLMLDLSTNSQGQTGLSYEMYLRFLLYSKGSNGDSNVSARTMDLVEMYMITQGRKDFRLDDYIYGMKIISGFELTGMGTAFEVGSVYTY